MPFGVGDFDSEKRMPMSNSREITKKVCASCKEIKPIVEFYKDARRKDGYYKRIGLKDVLFAICVHYFTQTPLNERMVGEFR